MMSTIFFNKYALLLITLLFSESILAMDNVEFQKLVIKNIYKVIPADRDKFRLVRPESGAKKFPLIYSNDKDRVKTINCTQRVEFDLLALGNIMGTLKLAVCPYSILGRDKMTEMEVAFYKELEIITTYKKLDEKQLEDAVLQHQFEKVETADEFGGNFRDMDGDDELDDHANALEDLNMKFTVRVDNPTHSVYQADFVM